MFPILPGYNKWKQVNALKKNYPKTYNKTGYMFYLISSIPFE